MDGTRALANTRKQRVRPQGREAGTLALRVFIIDVSSRRHQRVIPTGASAMFFPPAFLAGGRTRSGGTCCVPPLRDSGQMSDAYPRPRDPGHAGQSKGVKRGFSTYNQPRFRVASYYGQMLTPLFSMSSSAEAGCRVVR